MPRAPRLRTRPGTADRPDSEAGLTLVELLVAMTMMVAITAGAMAMLISAFKREPEVRERADQIGDARVAMEKMVRELRQGGAVEEAGKTMVRFDTSATCDSGGSCVVAFDCGGGTCRRYEGDSSGATLVAGLSNSEVFSYTPSEEPRFVGIRLRLPTPDGRTTTTLEDGATLRGFEAGDG